MKKLELTIGAGTSIGAFIASYFGALVIDNIAQFAALTAAFMIDGILGAIAGHRREGFKTAKALKVVVKFVVWSVMLFILLIIEKAYPAVGWMDETVILPVIIVQVLSAIKNAAVLGLIPDGALKTILDKYDKHKDL